MNNFFDREVIAQTQQSGNQDQINDYMRMTYMNSSKAFGGFSEDRLGRLAEDNKIQMHQAMRAMNGNNFRRTDQDFHGGRIVDNKGKIKIR